MQARNKKAILDMQKYLKPIMVVFSIPVLLLAASYFDSLKFVTKKILSSGNSTRSASIYQIRKCSAYDAVLNRKQALLEANKTNASETEILQQIIREPIFLELEKEALNNNECGGRASTLLFYLYSQFGFKERAEKNYQRLIDFANTNNSDAIAGLCGADFLSNKERLPYCEVVFNRSDNQTFKGMKWWAEVVLGNSYYQTKQVEKLISFCEKISDKKKGCVFTLVNLADDFYMENNYIEAFKLYLTVAQYDFTDIGMVQACVAAMYQHGLGVPKNLVSAIHWYEKAIQDLDDPLRSNYMNNVGAIHEDLKNYVVAFQWYQRAAKNGASVGQLNLARMYASGHGVLEDNRQAYAWASVALSQGLDNENKQIAVGTFKKQQAYILLTQDNNRTALKQAQELAQQYYKEYVLHEKVQSIKPGRSINNRLKAIVDAFRS